MRRCAVCGASRDVAPGDVFPAHPMFSVSGPLRWRWCPAGDVSGVIVGVES